MHLSEDRQFMKFEPFDQALTGLPHRMTTRMAPRVLDIIVEQHSNASKELRTAASYVVDSMTPTALAGLEGLQLRRTRLGEIRDAVLEIAAPMLVEEFIGDFEQS